jgi:hypothetical protein
MEKYETYIPCSIGKPEVNGRGWKSVKMDQFCSGWESIVGSFEQDNEDSDRIKGV